MSKFESPEFVEFVANILEILNHFKLETFMDEFGSGDHISISSYCGIRCDTCHTRILVDDMDLDRVVLQAEKHWREHEDD